MRLLTCGPYAGEFGYELMAWQAHCREMAQGYDRVIVGCREASAPLYDDFTSEFRFVPHSLETCCHRTKVNLQPVQSEFSALHRQHGGKWLQPRPRRGGKFIKYGTCMDQWAGLVVLHARDTPKTLFGRSSLLRNWPREKWEDLLGRFPGVPFVAIGLPGEAYCPPPAADARGTELGVVMDLLASCRLMIGPQSGPTHLAALCGCRHLVWTKRDQGPRGLLNEDRLRKVWNPLRTPVTIVDGFDASVESVEGALRNLLAASDVQPVTN